MSKSIMAAAIGLVFAVSIPVSAHATLALGIDFSSGAEDFGSSTWNLGWSFTVNTPVAVVGLGNWVGGSFPEDQQIGLWDSSGNLLASASVSNADPVVGNAPWSFAGITAVNLVVGQTYIVGGQGDADYTGEVATVSVDPRISYVTDLFTSISDVDSPLTEPTSSENAPYGWFGGNIELAPLAIPEPAAIALLGTAVLMLGAARHRKLRYRISE